MNVENGIHPLCSFHTFNQFNFCKLCGLLCEQLSVSTPTFCCTILATTMLQLCKKLLNIGTQQIPYPNGNHNS